MKSLKNFYGKKTDFGGYCSHGVVHLLHGIRPITLARQQKKNVLLL
ncbi:hypothetical protein [Schaedlerella arabinosiphila]|nr:hypothetical protein [Schaedlerella arabinosiphila]